MTEPESDRILGRAWETAAAAADRARVRIVDLADAQALVAVSRLLDEVWGRDPTAGTILAPEALVALAHAGGQVSGAFHGDDLVGATAAFIGLTPDGEVFLHSHVTGVGPGAEGRGVGRALKWHQRAWALQRGLTHVRWTFDPLIRRNAVLNLQLLGARAAAYHHDVYGRMQDARNAGAPTDRLVADWELTAARVEVAASGRTAEPDLSALRRAGAEAALTVGEASAPRLTPTDADRRLVQIPPDIEALRRHDPSLAATWGDAIRVALGEAMEGGMRVTGFTRDGWYVLGRDRGVQELSHSDGGTRP